MAQRSPVDSWWPGPALLAALCALGSGCAGLFQGIGNDLGKGVIAAVNADGPKAVAGLSDSLSTNLSRGVGEGLRTQVLNDDTNQRLETLVETLGKSAQGQLPAIREELVGKQTEAQLKATLDQLLKALDKQAQLTSRHVVVEVGQGLQRDVMSPENEARANALLASLLQTATVQGTQMREQLLAKSDEQIVRIVKASMQEVVLASEEIRAKAHQELSFVQRNANLTLAGAIALAGVIIFFVWRRNQQNRLLLELLMGQVHQSSADRESEMLAEVGRKAKALGIEGQLKSLAAVRTRAGEKEVKS